MAHSKTRPVDDRTQLSPPRRQFAKFAFDETADYLLQIDRPSNGSDVRFALKTIFKPKLGLPFTTTIFLYDGRCRSGQIEPLAGSGLGAKGQVISFSTDLEFSAPAKSSIQRKALNAACGG